jgi:hypothetical protein
MKLSNDMKRFIEIVGKERAEKICAAMTTRTIYIPISQKKCTGYFYTLLGNKRKEVCEEFKGEYVYFPDLFNRIGIHEKIRHDFRKNNMTYKELVKKYNMSLNYIRKICKEKE